MLATVVSGITTLLAFAGLCYYLVALGCARSFLRRPALHPASPLPPVSILKPVKGLDPGMYASFVSHCRQDYPAAYEILFGVSSLDDPAVEAIRRLQAEFPEHSIRIIHCTQSLGANGKVSNLVQMLPHARFDHLLISDSDITVTPRYLARVLSPFTAAAPGKPVGMVTAPYRGRAHATVGSKMEALGIATDFFPGVLTARRLEGGIRFGLGSTLAFSRTALAAARGLAPLVDHLADDYELGARISAAGYRVELSGEIVETSIPAYSLRGYCEHQLRWARGMRDVRRGGYAGLLFTFGLPWAVLNLIASGFSLLSVALFSLAFLARIALAVGVGVGILRDRQVQRDLWLLLPRDLLALGLWAWTYAGNTVLWRGEKFLLRKGKLAKLTPQQ